MAYVPVSSSMRGELTLRIGSMVAAGLLAACQPTSKAEAGAANSAGPKPAVKEPSAAQSATRAGTVASARSDGTTAAAPAAVVGAPEGKMTVAGVSGTGVSRAPRTQAGRLEWAKLARAQMRRPTDFAKLTAELKRKQALAAGLDEAAVRTELEKRALTGDADAALTLGLMLCYGDGAADKAQGEQLITAAAEAGNTRAMAELGRLLLADETRADGPAQAEAWLRKAWAAGESEGAYLLASAQRLGLLDAAAGEDSTVMLFIAAELDNEAAQRLLIRLYNRKEVDGMDDARKLRWTERFAEQGDIEAMYSAALLKESGGDPAGARSWFERAAAGGSVVAVKALSLRDDAIRDNLEVTNAVIEHLHAQLASPTTATAEASYTLAQYLVMRDKGAADPKEVLPLLKAASEQNDYRAALAAHMIEAGSDPRSSMLAVLGLNNETAYVRYGEATRGLIEHTEQDTARQVDVAARPVAAPTPIYPAELSSSKMEGSVTVQFFVDNEGLVSGVEVLESAHPAFSAAVMEALEHWRYKPAMKDGKPVATRNQLTFPFKLNK